MSQPTEQPEHLAEAHELIMALLEEQLQPDQVQRLEDLARQHQDVRRMYVVYVHQRCVMSTIAHPAGVLEDAGQAAMPPSLDDAMVLNAITSFDPSLAESLTHAPDQIINPS